MALARQAGFSDSQARTMAAIAMAESGGDPGIDTNQTGLGAVTGEYSIGLWQVNWNAHGDSLRARGLTPDDLRNPENNAREAYRIFSEAGGSFRPWCAYTNGSYRQFLQTGGGIGMQSGGKVTPAPSTSSSFYRSMSRVARNAGVYDGNGLVVVLAGSRDGAGTGTRCGTNGTTKPPTLSASPRTLVAADYLARVGLRMKLA